MFQNIFYTTYNLLGNISPCFNDSSSIPGLDGQLQGSDGVREAIAAKCIGQEIIGRIHDVLY